MRNYSIVSLTVALLVMAQALAMWRPNAHVAPEPPPTRSGEPVTERAGPGYFSDGPTVFWVSAEGAGGIPPNVIAGFDADGIFTGEKFDQLPGAWYRDGASDRAGFMYFGWEEGVARHDDNGANGVQVFQGPAPGGVGTWRALAYDPAGDNGNGSFWSQSFGSSLVEVKATDFSLIRIFANPGNSLYGLAYDDADGNLWGHSTAGEVVKIDTTTGAMIPGAGWPSGFVNLAAQAGLSGTHDGTGAIAAISQGTPDELGVYDDSGTLIGGPWDLAGQTGSGSLSGVAVVVTGGGGLSGIFDCQIGGGVATLSVSGGTPNGRVAIVAGTNGGQFTIPNGFPCAGTIISTRPPFLPGFPVIGSFDGNGDFSISGTLPAGLCEQIRGSAIDLATCDLWP